MASRERCLRETYSFLKHALEHELEVDALRQEIAGQLDLVEAFRVLDEGDKGYLTAADVRSFCVRTNRGMREPPAEALMALLRQYDQDVDGCWSPTEFVQMLRVERPDDTGTRSPPRAAEHDGPSPAALRLLARFFEAELSAFTRSELDRRLMASAGVGAHEAVLAVQGSSTGALCSPFLTSRHLISLFEMHGAKLGGEELRRLTARLDLDRDKIVSYNDFVGSVKPGAVQASLYTRQPTKSL